MKHTWASNNEGDVKLPTVCLVCFATKNAINADAECIIPNAGMWQSVFADLPAIGKRAAEIREAEKIKESS